MAVIAGEGGTFETVLRMRDEATPVMASFGEKSKAQLNGTAKAFEAGGEAAGKAKAKIADSTKEAEESSGRFGTATKAVALAAAAVGTTAVAMAKHYINVADAMNQASERTGLSTEALSAWQYIGGQSGQSAEKLNTAFETMSRNLSKAADGAGPASKALKTLGLDADQLRQAGPDAAVLSIADALDKVPDKMDRVRLAGEIFGKGAASMNVVLAGGSKAFQDAYAEADKFGLIIDTKSAKAADTFNDNMFKLSKALEGISFQVGKGLVGPLADLSGKFVAIAKDTGAFKVVGEALGLVLKTLAGGLVVVGGIAAATGKTIGGTAAALTALISGNFSGAKQIITDLAKDIADVTKESKRLLTEFFKPVAYVPENSVAGMMRKVAYGGPRPEMQRGFGGQSQEPFTYSDVLPGADTRNTDKATAAAMGTARGQLALGVHNIEEMLKTDEQRIQESYDRRLQIIDAAEALQLNTETNYASMRTELERRKQEELTQLHHQQANSRYGVTVTFNQLGLQSSEFFFSQLGALMQTKSRALFEIGKAGAIAETIIQTYRAAQGAYAAMASIPFVGPALGAAAAAAAIAVGFARVQAIKSTSFGSASGSPVLSGGGASGPVTTQSAPVVPYTAPNQGTVVRQREVVIQLSGNDVFSAASIRDSLIPALNDAIGDGAVIRVQSA